MERARPRLGRLASTLLFFEVVESTNDVALEIIRSASRSAFAEGAPDGTVVLGYGINVAATAFPPELGDRATSLESELGRAVDRPNVLVETLAALSQRYEDLLAGRFDAILGAWRRHAPAASGAQIGRAHV